MSTDIVQNVGGEPRVSSQTIADRTGNEHRAVLQLVNTHTPALESFGEVAFEMRPGYNNSVVRVAQLNEPQATLLITFMRNLPVVVAFKVALVRAFHEMRHALAHPAVPQTLPDALRAYAAEVEAREAIAARNRELEPKAERWDEIASAGGDYAVGDVAKLLVRAGFSTGQNRLFKILDAKGWTFVRGGARQAMQSAVDTGYVVEKVQRPRAIPGTGELRAVAPQIRVTGKGLDRLMADLVPTRALRAVN